MLSDAQIEKNFAMFVNLCTKLGERSAAASALVEAISARLATAPASSRTQYHAAYPGGLVDHSLRVLNNARKINETFKMGLTNESMIIACLFHDLGKAGDLDAEYYIQQDDAWRQNKLGEMYKINEAMQKMPNAERGLWLLQHFCVKLTIDEWIAIRINDGQYVSENKYYAMHEPPLAVVVHMADRLACEQEKEKKSV